jgi:hypothetical protein
MFHHRIDSRLVAVGNISQWIILCSDVRCYDCSGRVIFLIPSNWHRQSQPDTAQMSCFSNHAHKWWAWPPLEMESISSRGRHAGQKKWREKALTVYIAYTMRTMLQKVHLLNLINPPLHVYYPRCQYQPLDTDYALVATPCNWPPIQCECHNWWQTYTNREKSEGVNALTGSNSPTTVDKWSSEAAVFCTEDSTSRLAFVGITTNLQFLPVVSAWRVVAMYCNNYI